MKRQKDDQKQRAQNKRRKILGAPPAEEQDQPEDAGEEYQDCGIQSI
jgi:hypothetical protein